MIKIIFSSNFGQFYWFWFLQYFKCHEHCVKLWYLCRTYIWMCNWNQKVAKLWPWKFVSKPVSLCQNVKYTSMRLLLCIELQEYISMTRISVRLLVLISPAKSTYFWGFRKVPCGRSCYQNNTLNYQWVYESCDIRKYIISIICISTLLVDQKYSRSFPRKPTTKFIFSRIWWQATCN